MFQATPPPAPVLLLRDNLGGRYDPPALAVPAPLRLEPPAPPAPRTARLSLDAPRSPEVWIHPALDHFLDIAFHLMDGRHFH